MLDFLQRAEVLLKTFLLENFCSRRGFGPPSRSDSCVKVCAVDVRGFQQLFQSEAKRCCFRQDVQAADMVFGTLLQSEAAECGPSFLEAGFGKLASKVDLPQGAGSREAPWRA